MMTSDFRNDYSAIQHDLVDNTITLDEAEKRVLYWQDAMPNNVIQEAVLQLRYEYIQKLYKLYQ